MSDFDLIQWYYLIITAVAFGADIYENETGTDWLGSAIAVSIVMPIFGRMCLWW